MAHNVYIHMFVHLKKTTSQNKGFTLIETLLYIVLFSFIMTSGIYAAYQLIDSSHDLANKTTAEADADFLLRKIDWALNGYTSIVQPTEGNSGSQLSINTPNGLQDFTFANGVVYLNGNTQPLTSDRVTISSFFVHHIAPTAGAPRAVELSFMIDGKQFGTTTRYLR